VNDPFTTLPGSYLELESILKPLPDSRCRCRPAFFVLAKKLQWSFPEKFGEEKLYVLFDGLHLQKKGWSLLLNLLKESGWIEMLIDTAGIIPSSSEKL